jgi:hypothetical protein
MCDNIVKCPNMCMVGQVKHYPDQRVALFTTITCPYCKGKGEVTKEKAIEIDKNL